MWGRSMEACRSFYLNSDHDDHAELTAKADRSNVIAIPYVTPANDNVPTVSGCCHTVELCFVV